MKKNFLSILLILPILSACGSTGTTTAVITCKNYWFETVGACLPDNWNVLDRATLDQRGVAEDTIIAFQMKDAVSGQFPTVSITKEPLATVVDSATYSDATIRSVTVLPAYKLIDKKKSTIDKVATSIHVFTAQPTLSEPMRKFYQVSTVNGSIGYTVTALTPVSVSAAVENAVLAILGSMTFQGATSAGG